jgi:hypothetical protein
VTANLVDDALVAWPMSRLELGEELLDLEPARWAHKRHLDLERTEAWLGWARKAWLVEAFVVGGSDGAVVAPPAADLNGKADR